MSENKISNEQELWDQLNSPVKTEPKAKPAPKRVDGFFVACMAGVAAVSVAATLVIGGMVGGDKVPTTQVKEPVSTGAPSADGEQLAALEQENAQLREQVRLQKEQIKELQAQILDLTGSAADLPTSPADSDTTDPQVEAYAIFNQIQEAYADFDRETLEELIPEMDKRLTYLSSDALNSYYKILEYVEMPSNG